MIGGGWPRLPEIVGQTGQSSLITVGKCCGRLLCVARSANTPNFQFQTLNTIDINLKRNLINVSKRILLSNTANVNQQRTLG